MIRLPTANDIGFHPVLMLVFYGVIFIIVCLALLTIVIGRPSAASVRRTNARQFRWLFSRRAIPIEGARSLHQSQDVSIQIERSISGAIGPIEMSEKQLNAFIKSVSNEPLGFPNLIGIEQLGLTETDNRLNQSHVYPRWWTCFEKSVLDELLNTFANSLHNLLGKNQPFITLNHINFDALNNNLINSCKDLAVTKGKSAENIVFEMCSQCLSHGIFPQLIWLYLSQLIKDEKLLVSPNYFNQAIITENVRQLTRSEVQISLKQTLLIVNMYSSLKDKSKDYYEKLADLEYLFGFNYSQKQIALVLKYSGHLSLKDSVTFYPLPRSDEYKNFQRLNKKQRDNALLSSKTLYFVKLVPKNGGPILYKWGITEQTLANRFKSWLSRYELHPIKAFELTSQIAFVVEQIILNHFHVYSELGLVGDARYETFNQELSEAEVIKFAYSAYDFVRRIADDNGGFLPDLLVENVTKWPIHYLNRQGELLDTYQMLSEKRRQYGTRYNKESFIKIESQKPRLTVAHSTNGKVSSQWKNFSSTFLEFFLKSRETRLFLDKNRKLVLKTMTEPEERHIYGLNADQQMATLNKVLMPVLDPMSSESNVQNQDETLGRVWGLTRHFEYLTKQTEAGQNAESTTNLTLKSSKKLLKNTKALALEKPVNKFAYLENLPFDYEAFQRFMILFYEENKTLWLDGTISFVIQNGRLIIHDKRQEKHNKKESGLKPVLPNRPSNTNNAFLDYLKVIEVSPIMEILTSPFYHKGQNGITPKKGLIPMFQLTPLDIDQTLALLNPKTDISTISGLINQPETWVSYTLTKPTTIVVEKPVLSVSLGPSALKQDVNCLKSKASSDLRLTKAMKSDANSINLASDFSSPSSSSSSSSFSWSSDYFDSTCDNGVMSHPLSLESHPIKEVTSHKLIGRLNDSLCNPEGFDPFRYPRSHSLPEIQSFPLPEIRSYPFEESYAFSVKKHGLRKTTIDTKPMKPGASESANDFAVGLNFILVFIGLLCIEQNLITTFKSKRVNSMTIVSVIFFGLIVYYQTSLLQRYVITRLCFLAFQAPLNGLLSLFMVEFEPEQDFEIRLIQVQPVSQELQNQAMVNLMFDGEHYL